MLCVVTGTRCSRFAKPYPLAATTSPFLTTARAIPGIFCRDISAETNRSITGMRSDGIPDAPVQSIPLGGTSLLRSVSQPAKAAENPLIKQEHFELAAVGEKQQITSRTAEPAAETKSTKAPQCPPLVGHCQATANTVGRMPQDNPPGALPRP